MRLLLKSVVFAKKKELRKEIKKDYEEMTS